MRERQQDRETQQDGDTTGEKHNRRDTTGERDIYKHRERGKGVHYKSGPILAAG